LQVAHALIQDGVYGSLTNVRKRELHLAAAEIFPMNLHAPRSAAPMSCRVGRYKVARVREYQGKPEPDWPLEGVSGARRY